MFIWYLNMLRMAPSFNIWERNKALKKKKLSCIFFKLFWELIIYIKKILSIETWNLKTCWLIKKGISSYVILGGVLKPVFRKKEKLFVGQSIIWLRKWLKINHMIIAWIFGAWGYCFMNYCMDILLFRVTMKRKNACI